MSKKKAEEKKPAPMELIDPVFPLPPKTGIPPVRQGEGKAILHNDEAVRIVELPYRAFWILWEHVEKRGAESYVRYKGGPLDHVAQAYLEAVAAFRNADRAKFDLMPLEVFDEKTERKLRKRQKKGLAAPEPSSNGSKPAEAKSEVPEEAPQCDARHKVDGKKRRCVRKPDHKGRHKDRKGERW